MCLFFHMLDVDPGRLIVKIHTFFFLFIDLVLVVGICLVGTVAVLSGRLAKAVCSRG